MNHVEVNCLDLNIYDRVLFKELKYTTYTWNTRNNTLGTRVGNAEALPILRPLNNVSMLLMFSSISGIFQSMALRYAEAMFKEVDISSYSKGSGYYKKFTKYLDSWTLFREVLTIVKNREEIPDNLSPWQRKALKAVMG
uniref:Uncharacterized protein n=1 Tax=Ignisphaera aggregans TaxID=334771 RepID=A0A7C4FII3_9CREN